MGIIDVNQQFCGNVSTFIFNNQALMVQRTNDYLKKTGSAIVVTRVSMQGLSPIPILTDFAYTAETNLTTTPILAFEESVNNTDNNSAVDVTVSYSKTLQESFAFTFNEGIELSTTVSVKAKLPLIGKAEASITGTASFESSQTWTQIESKTWSANNQVKINAGESADIQVTISNGKMSVPFTAKMIMGPKTLVLLSVDGNVKSPCSIGVPLSALFTANEVLNNLSISFTGTLKGVEGVGVITTVTPTQPTA